MSIYAKLYRWYGGDSMTRACSGPGIVTICLSATNAFSSSSWRRAASTIPPSGFIALALLMHSRIVFPGAYSAHACRRASTFKLLFVVERGCIECGSLVAPRPQFGYPFLDSIGGPVRQFPVRLVPSLINTERRVRLLVRLL